MRVALPALLLLALALPASAAVHSVARVDAELRPAGAGLLEVRAWLTGCQPGDAALRTTVVTFYVGGKPQQVSTSRLGCPEEVFSWKVALAAPQDHDILVEAGQASVYRGNPRFGGTLESSTEDTPRFRDVLVAGVPSLGGYLAPMLGQLTVAGLLLARARLADPLRKVRDPSSRAPLGR